MKNPFFVYPTAKTKVPYIQQDFRSQNTTISKLQRKPRKKKTDQNKF
jgi:hypothetical protein